MYDDDDKPKKKKGKKPGQWSPMDILFAIFGILVLIALVMATFLAVKWAKITFLG